jgi:hypothetical protein
MPPTTAPWVQGRVPLTTCTAAAAPRPLLITLDLQVPAREAAPAWLPGTSRELRDANPSCSYSMMTPLPRFP